MRAAVLFSIFFCLFTWQLPFYGDAVTLVSAPAQFYYEEDFSSLLLPDALATGHPPLYPMIVALLWMLFGKQLAIVHVWMLCCSLFFLTQAAKLAKIWLEDVQMPYFLLLLLCYPVLWAQTAGMGPDLLLCSLFLLSARAIIERRPVALVIGVAVMTLISLRGIMLAAGLWGMIMLYPGADLRFRLRYSLLLLVSGLPVAGYFLLQFLQNGWFLLPPSGNWSGHRSVNSGWLWGAKGFELVLRLFEFGMIVPMFWVIFRFRGLRKGGRDNQLTILFIATLMAFIVFLLPFRGPVLIRYMMPVHVLVLMLFCRINIPKTTKRLAFGFTVLLMLAQHFIVYPQMRRSIFEYSWGDGSLVHMSYFPLREEVHKYLKEANIPAEEIHTSFPEYKPFSLTDLSNNTDVYSELDVDSIGNYKYILYANNMNMITNDQLHRIETLYTAVHSWGGYPLRYTLYKARITGNQGE